ncbi:RNA-directed DNA polymerase, eukaryota, reverse transcriptase zinc-binding domain protein [Tanacetum coccineum]
MILWLITAQNNNLFVVDFREEKRGIRQRRKANRAKLLWPFREAAKIHSVYQGPLGRQILDGCLIANEIIRMAHIEDHKLLLFKVDFEKAFDSVNWEFLFDVMKQFGFGDKWIGWIRSCLSSASISVLINGSPTKEFSMERGLQQGDPLSPLLFLLVAESLQSRSNAQSLVNILRCFELASRLKVNIGMSRIFGIGVPNEDVQLLSAWKAKSLSIGGRLTLIKSVLGFKDSQRGISWVKWKSMLFDPDKRGLGIGSIHATNLGLLGKWKWRFLTRHDALWRLVIREFYGEDGGFCATSNSSIFGRVWGDIIKASASIESIVAA